MSVIIILILVSVSVATLFLIAFFWSVKNGQFDDTESPAVRILYDNDNVKPIKTTESTTQQSSKTQ